MHKAARTDPQGLEVFHSPERAILFTVAAPYYSAAEHTMGSMPATEGVIRLSEDTGCVVLSRRADRAVEAESLPAQVPFIRHLAFPFAAVPASDPSAEALSELALEHLLKSSDPSSTSSLQIWASGDSPIDPARVKAALQEETRRAGFTLESGGRNRIMGVYLCDQLAVLSDTPKEAALCDWAGGRMRLRSTSRQISRSEFKLEEALTLYPLELRPGARAVDFGASPGGWTRILVEKGLIVWAVDPGALATPMTKDPAVRHVQMTANRFLRTEQPTTLFDLAVNDMRMPPELSSRLMVKASGRLERGAHIIMTLKVTPRTVLASLGRSVAILERAYDIRFLRQLFHNRNELTVIAQRRS